MPQSYYSCACHPFKDWEDVKAANGQRFAPGDQVVHRCLGRHGTVHDASVEQDPQFVTVSYGPLPRDRMLEHVSELAREENDNQ